MRVTPERADDEMPRTGALRAAHLLFELRPSGAERMLQCSFNLWREHGIEPIVFGLSEGPHPFAPVLRSVGYQTVVIPRNSRSLGGLAALRSALADLEPDIVHIHNESMFPMASLLARATPAVRGVVRSVHSNFAYRGLLVPRRILFSRAAAALGVVSVACGEGVADNEESRYHHRPHVVENWVDVVAFAGDLDKRVPAVRAQLGLTARDFVVMLLGNCEPVKGHALFLNAIADVRRPIVVLHVGGEENVDDAERAAWQRVSAPHRLTRLGRRDDVATLLAAADVLAMPSDQGEGFGIAAAESFCAATPVIASRVPGLAWVTDFRTGRTVERCTSAWAAALERTPARNCGNEWMMARERDGEVARQRFSPERGVAEWRRLYDLAIRVRFPSPVRIVSAHANTSAETCR